MQRQESCVNVSGNLLAWLDVNTTGDGTMICNPLKKADGKRLDKPKGED